MSRWRTERSRVALRTERSRVALLWSAQGLTDGSDHTWPGWPEFAAEHPGAEVAVLVDSARECSLLMPPDLPLQTDAEREAYARRQYQHYLGDEAAQWPLRCWQLRGCWGHTALLMPADALQLPAGLRLVSLQPLWWAAFEAVAWPTGWASLTVADEGGLTWLLAEDGELRSLVQRRVGAVDALELEADAPPGCQPLPCPPLPELLAAAAQPPRRRAANAIGPQFVRPRSRAQALGWAWCAAALLAAGAVGWQLLELRAEAERLDAQARVLDQLQARPQAGASRSRASPDATLQKRAWLLHDQLAEPWGERWLAVEQALPAELQLQALDLSSSLLRLEGASSRMEVVTALVEQLSQQAAASDEVLLSRVQAAAPGGGVSFEVQRRPRGSKS